MKSRRLKLSLMIAAAMLFATLAAACGGRTSGSTVLQGDTEVAASQGLRGLSVDVGGDDAFSPTGKLVEYELMATQAPWEIVSGVTTIAVTYNGTVPGPLLRVTEGDTLRVSLRNELSEPTTIHWHGVHVPSEMDGVTGVSQAPVMPGESFTYEFIASHAGTFMYHSHSHNSAEQIDQGLYGVLIIDPQQKPSTEFDREYVMALQGWMVDAADMDGMDGMSGDGMDTEAMMQMLSQMMEMMSAPGGQEAMPGQMDAAAMADMMAQMMEMASSGQSSGGHGGMDYNYFTINGKAFPDTEPYKVRTGDVVRVRIVNPSQTIHPMHLHGQDFKVVAKDGEPIAAEAQLMMNTITLNPGETYDIVFVADNPGRWVFHCHDLHHASNNGVEPGGLTVLVEYEDYQGPAVPTAVATPQMPGMSGPGMDGNSGSMPGMGH
jgi:FtsP/CotA-like multicopper oxidase with cupredoxin domain